MKHTRRLLGTLTLHSQWHLEMGALLYHFHLPLPHPNILPPQMSITAWILIGVGIECLLPPVHFRALSEGAFLKANKANLPRLSCSQSDRDESGPGGSTVCHDGGGEAGGLLGTWAEQRQDPGPEALWVGQGREVPPQASKAPTRGP